MNCELWIWLRYSNSFRVTSKFMPGLENKYSYWIFYFNPLFSLILHFAIINLVCRQAWILGYNECSMERWKTLVFTMEAMPTPYMVTNDIISPVSLYYMDLSKNTDNNSPEWRPGVPELVLLMWFGPLSGNFAMVICDLLTCIQLLSDDTDNYGDCICSGKHHENVYNNSYNHTSLNQDCDQSLDVCRHCS